MKLPDFSTHPDLNALRARMGAAMGRLEPARNRDILTPDEIAQLTRQGIEISSLADIRVLEDGTLAYKNSRVILYIRDANVGQEPRFHLADCRTLDTMRANNRADRYVVATNDSGIFPLNRMQKDGPPYRTEEKLAVCQNCLDRLTWQGFRRGSPHEVRNAIVARFSIAEFFQVYKKTFIIQKPRHDAETAPLNVYSDDFAQQAEKLKAQRQYRCDQCGIDLTQHRRFLHAHHKNGQKHDSRPENLSILCLGCHAEQFQHGHLKALPEYQEFQRLRPGIVSGDPPWHLAARALAREHGLQSQDWRRDGGCLWVYVNGPRHPVAAPLERLGFQYSEKRQGFWRKE